MTTTVGILGVTHDPAIREKYQYPLSLVRELIEEFDPQVICGEVLPESWEIYKKEGRATGFPGKPASEYGALLFPLCEEKGITFVPIDWLELDVWMDFDPFQGAKGDQSAQWQKELELWNERQFATWNAGAIPFNTAAYDEVTRRKYEWLEEINPQAALFRWTCRHLIMIQRIKNAISAHQGKRVLCIAGADHNYGFYEGLAVEKDIRLVYPLRK